MMRSVVIIIINVAIFFGKVSSANTVCTSNLGLRCWPKSENARWTSLYDAGDPCFLYGRRRSCFVSSSMLHPCTCTASCGCGSGEVVPDCPASQRPEPMNCTADKQKYCSQGSDNTMCANCNVNPNCAFCKHDLSQENKNAILNLHNKLRARVANGEESGQPKAANMNKLIWSDELAKIAQRWADQCPSHHDVNRKSPDFPSEPGQNLADSWSSVNSFDYNLADRIQSWYEEVKDWPASNVDSFTSSGATGTVGHFTQVVWADTRYIGCGAIYYKDTNPNVAKYPYRKTLVCNYYPAGNWLGRPVYITGDPGSKCASRKSENGLCI